jgi:hypothetical protein
MFPRRDQQRFRLLVADGVEQCVANLHVALGARVELHGEEVAFREVLLRVEQFGDALRAQRPHPHTAYIFRRGAGQRAVVRREQCVVAVAPECGRRAEAAPRAGAARPRLGARAVEPLAPWQRTVDDPADLARRVGEHPVHGRAGPTREDGAALGDGVGLREPDDGEIQPAGLEPRRP